VSLDNTLPKWARAIWRGLKRERWTKKKGWRRKLAAEFEVAPSTVTRWLSGERMPSRPHRRKLCKLLKLSPEIWL